MADLQNLDGNFALVQEDMDVFLNNISKCSSSAAPVATAASAVMDYRRSDEYLQKKARERAKKRRRNKINEKFRELCNLLPSSNQREETAQYLKILQLQAQMYHPGFLPIGGQQQFFGQVPHPMMPSQAGFGYPQQLVPGMPSGSGSVPNFFIPMVQPGQPGPVQQPQQLMTLMQQQMGPWGCMFPYPVLGGCNVPNMPIPAGVGGDWGMLPQDAQPPMPIPQQPMPMPMPQQPMPMPMPMPQQPMPMPMPMPMPQPMPMPMPVPVPMPLTEHFSALAKSNIEQQPMTLMQQQMLQWEHMFQYPVPGGNNVPNMPMPESVGGDGGLLPQDAQQPMPMPLTEHVSSLTKSNIEQQQTM